MRKEIGDDFGGYLTFAVKDKDDGAIGDIVGQPSKMIALLPKESVRLIPSPSAGSRRHWHLGEGGGPLGKFEGNCCA